MLFKCPSCGARIRVSTLEFRAKDKLVRYLCQECEQIVHLDVSDAIPSSSSAPKEQAGPQIFRILIADDTHAFRKAVEDLLIREGFQVTTASDGIEALRKVLEEHPDAVLLDLFMPQMSGFEVLKELRTNPGYKNVRNTPVLVTSGVYKPAEIEMIHDLANGFISKEAIPEFLPFRLKKLLASPATEGKV